MDPTPKTMATPTPYLKIEESEASYSAAEEEEVGDGGNDDLILGLEECILRDCALEPTDAQMYSESSSEDDFSSGADSQDDHFEPIVKNETLAVNRTKLLVFAILVLVGASFGSATYLLLSYEDQDNFMNELRVIAKDIGELVNSQTHTTAAEMSNLATHLTSEAINSGSKWPFCSLPDFARRTNQAVGAMVADLLAVVPIVESTEQDEWESYAVDNQAWIKEALVFNGNSDVDPELIPEHIYDPVVTEGKNYSEVNDSANRTLLPLWQMAPVTAYNASDVMKNMGAVEVLRNLTVEVAALRHVVFSEVSNVDYVHQESLDHPHSYVIAPFFQSFVEAAEVEGFVILFLSWNKFFKSILRDSIRDVVLFVEDQCGNDFSYRVSGHQLTEFLGYGDHHDPKFDDVGIRIEIENESLDRHSTFSRSCDYTMTVYPTLELEESFETKDPTLFACLVAWVFVITAAIFIFYDLKVQRRQLKMMAAAEQTTAIVSSLFPKNVQSRIMDEVQEKINKVENDKKWGFKVAPKAQLREFLHDDEDANSSKGPDFLKTKPIADLFPETTIMFADIVGFTAWSSMREPSQVFMLLESIYHAFDEIAKRRRIFKVETVGDCYVAVAGLPEPRNDHAVAMARFARQCLVEVLKLVKNLEETLGPDTAELGMRFGLHSGPVTAGVLRGERSRFQLFGDSVNTASRMESTSERNRIQISQATADKLTDLGKGHWFRARAEKVVAKGKGELQTYWLENRGSTTGGSSYSSGSRSSEHTNSSGSARQRVGSADDQSTILGSISDQIPRDATLSDKYLRLVKWNADILSKLLQLIVVRREVSGTEPDPCSKIEALEQATLDKNKETTVLDEVREVISLPTFQSTVYKQQRDPDSVDLGSDVMEQLNQYIQTIAMLYRNDNPFHNFAHESQVSMSVCKLLSRIVAPDDLENLDKGVEKTLHDHTYGITSDPLTQFAVVFSALVHDVDHPGVPNTQLVKEGVDIASVYKNKSIAEQNSVDIAWTLLMEPTYADLRQTIYTTVAEFKRFRQLVVNAVMATDIMDKELGAARKARWNKAFADGNAIRASSSMDGGEDQDTERNRKATIVIEHVIQASDVAHTMQHWHIYRKWNARLFEEMYKAHKEGRAQKDPSEFWYEGEIGFFDYYIIPLARKLKDCGVFGVSSDEYLSYAIQNRQEWEYKGRQIVAELVESVQKKEKK